jgi:hypothetical protein
MGKVGVENRIARDINGMWMDPDMVCNDGLRFDTIDDR